MSSELPESLRRLMAADHAPVRGYSAVRRASLPLVFALGCAVLTLLLAPRGDAVNAPMARLLVPAVTLFVALGAAFSAVLARGRSGLGWAAPWRWAVLAIAATAYELASALVSDHESVSLAAHEHCATSGTALGLLVTAALLAAAHRTAPASPRSAGALAGAAGGFAGSLVLHAHCPAASFAHTGLAHAVPVVVCALVGALVGRRTMVA